MKFSLNTMLAIPVCVYAGLMLAWFSFTYCAMVMVGEPFHLPSLVVYTFAANMILFAGVIAGLYDKQYEWRGMIVPSIKTARICRSVLLMSLLNCVVSFLWLCVASTSPEWNKDSRHAERLIGQVFTSIQISWSLSIFLYSLFGITSIASERVIRFYRDPLAVLKFRGRKLR